VKNKWSKHHKQAQQVLSRTNSQHMHLREDERSSKVNDKKIKNGGGGQEGSH
jgi:hypothetical protein